MVVVFFILLLSLATLEAQRNENDSFFDLMTAIGEDFGGEFNDTKKVLKLDLDGANSFLEGLHRFATREIIRKNKNGEFECKESKKPFIEAIKAILGENTQNLLKAHIVPKQSKTVLNTVYTIKTILDEKSDKTVEDFLNALFVPKKSDEMPSASADSVKFSEKKLFNLLFSFAARLEALVHGKNSDGTLKEKKENSKDKIQTFLAVPKCFQESDLSIFDYWIEIIEMKTKKSQEPIFGVAIYKEKYDKYRWENSKQKAFELSRENYQILEQLNHQKFSFYESLNLLRAAFNWGYRHVPGGKIPQIFMNLLSQINSVFVFNWKRNEYWHKNEKCAHAMFIQNNSESLMKMMSDKGIDPKLHLESIDFKIQEDVQKDVEESCYNDEAKIIFLNNVHYELVINFEFNQRKDVYDRVEDLLSDWVSSRRLSEHGIYPLSEKSYLKKNASQMLYKIKHFTLNTNLEAISIIEALIGKEFNLGALFDQIKTLVEETIPEEEANLEKAKKEINTEQLENDIEFLNTNPKNIAEEKYQKAVAIIRKINQFGEKVEILTSKINIKMQEQLIKLSSTIHEKYNIGPELWKQTNESCNQLKLKQIKMGEEENVSEEILLDDLQFELSKKKRSIERGWRGIEEYYLSIPLMQLIERARTLAKTFGKMLQNVKENYS